ncbi:hypothetical protein ROTO_36260 [Roseovarius tolerans]|uniref:DDE domain-containing protein n=2 Tax=Roseovarius tolerans TaxID=74031 RepID=A0A0L6CQ04_9RHOB|nr:hypothetical protein ROTO_36260 [Roseovarius tolerans]
MTFKMNSGPAMNRRTLMSSMAAAGAMMAAGARGAWAATPTRGGHVRVGVRVRSYGAAMKEIGNADRQETGRWLNNRAENSHLPFRRRERAMQRFRRLRSLQKFAAVHASVYNLFNSERSLYSRSNFKRNRALALAEWRNLCTA